MLARQVRPYEPCRRRRVELGEQVLRLGVLDRDVPGQLSQVIESVVRAVRLQASPRVFVRERCIEIAYPLQGMAALLACGEVLLDEFAISDKRAIERVASEDVIAHVLHHEPPTQRVE